MGDARKRPRRLGASRGLLERLVEVEAREESRLASEAVRATLVERETTTSAVPVKIGAGAPHRRASQGSNWRGFTIDHIIDSSSAIAQALSENTSCCTSLSISC